jgi:hypothetical protein
LKAGDLLSATLRDDDSDGVWNGIALEQLPMSSLKSGGGAGVTGGGEAAA